MASPVAQSVKNLPAMQETQVRSLGWEDSLQKEMATHSSIFAWEIPWIEITKEVDTTYLQNISRHIDVENKHDYQGVRRLCCCCLVAKLYPPLL